MVHNSAVEECDPKVSVLMSTYNRPEYLKEAIQSVIDQRFQDWELLVINDGGMDVGEIVQAFGDERIRYFNRRKNRWKAACSNFGLYKAKGGYIAYLDDDDHWYDNHLQVLSETLDQYPEIGAVYSDLYAVSVVNDKKTGKRYPVHKTIRVSRDFNRDFMFYYNHALHVSLMHRKELAIRAGGYDESLTVLDDWNIARKMSFFTEFKYVPMLTGEYYMPLSDSDRNSVLERQDPERFRHNVRKIKADLPPKPWPYVKTVGIIIPVWKWDEAALDFISTVYDKIFRNFELFRS